MAGLTSKSEVERSSRAELMKKYGPKIKSDFGQDEYNFIKEDSTGPGGVDRLRKHVLDLFMNKGGMVKKRKLAKGGAMVAKKKMRGGGMAKMASKKMRGGGVAAKKMRGGGMAKMAKKKMMRGGMAKKK